jgi:hypothetical protein
MNDGKIKAQILEKIKSSTNVLVTVSNNPSVDALSAALGLTLMLNKLGKHATAVFSGAIPPAISFLDPGKTFESTTDSLRDFIIALDKEKADHLRYKVDGDVVKIFITPYRTTITSDDLDFSQGDYNVEMVIALGVDNQDHLDSALEAHGSILHDATVATISAGEQVSNLGSLDWHEEQASGLSEMLVSLADGLKSDKDKEPLLDATTATALLTGIVASTDRFSNTRTSSRVMTIAAQLMGAGADQQLIAAKLEESHEIGSSQSVKSDGVILTEGTSSKVDKTPVPPLVAKDGGIDIVHTQEKTLEQITNEVKEHEKVEEETIIDPDSATVEPVTLPAPAESPSISLAHAYASEEPGPSISAGHMDEPMLGGTLNATTEQAAEDAQRERDSDQNKTILSHAYLSDTPTYNTPINSASEADEPASGDTFADQQPANLGQTQPQVMPDALVPPTETVEPVATQTLSDLDAQTRDGASREDALAAVHASYSGIEAPVAPASFSPVPGIVLPPPPPLPDFSALPPAPSSAYAPEPIVAASETERLGDIFPDPAAPPAPTGPADPGQFRIPGQ